MDKFIDLHLHLDGAISADIAKKLADIQNIKLPFKSDEELEKALSLPKECENLNDFLKCFEYPLTLLQTCDGIENAIYLVLEKLQKQNIIYAEIRFAPQLHMNKGLTMEEVITAAIKGLNRAPIKANLILCLMRGENTHNANFETIELAKKYLVRTGGVVAIDLAGAEGVYKTSGYKVEFELARKYDIPFTIHAGEADGYESVKTAIEFGAIRIGHGIRAIENEDTVEEIIQKGIVLEMCPTSNRQTKAVSDMNHYPLQYYLQKGVKVTINTDDMAISNTNIQEEFEYIENMYGITNEQEKTLAKNAIEGAFTDDITKLKLKELLNI